MLARFNPFQRVEDDGSLLPSLLFRDFQFPIPGFDASSTLAPAADIAEDENALRLSVDLPGHDPKNVQVKLDGDTLTIRSERKAEKTEKGQNFVRTERTFGVFARSFVLPNTVDASKAEARYENGVLSLTLPKKEEAKPRSLEIKVQH